MNKEALTEDLTGLYRLAFLLAGDHQKAERCLVAAIEGCVSSNHIFKEWAHFRAKRTIIQGYFPYLFLHPRCLDC